MSADNGIYILETGTDKKEYRVRELQAVENIDYDQDAPEFRYCPHMHTISQDHDCRTCPDCLAWDKKFNSDDPDVQIKNAREMWAGCQAFDNKSDALNKAYEMLKECYICEYGISVIEVARDF